jgi:hypothetical protein
MPSQHDFEGISCLFALSVLPDGGQGWRVYSAGMIFSGDVSLRQRISYSRKAEDVSPGC